MNKRVLIIGSTGKLGTKLIKYCKKNNLNITAITCFNNSKKIQHQSESLNIKKSFILSQKTERNKFIHYLKKNKFKIIYFLDYGSSSLTYINILLSNNTNSIFAIANKEMIIAGGPILIKRIKKTKNRLIPLDSEHFSLQKSFLLDQAVKNLFITASGGPFYFNKNIKLSNVSMTSVLKHPKWDMGFNNSIDSSNFINKILEMFELSSIYSIDLSKIDFLVSENAFVHSLIFYKDNTISVNCYNNNMLIPLIKPLTDLFDVKELSMDNENIFDSNNFKLEKFKDKRFNISKYIKNFKKLSHFQQIELMILNNKAHSLYICDKIKYLDIIPFITRNLFKKKKIVNLNSINDILKYISTLETKYEIYN